MKKYFITSDTHSFYNELIKELNNKEFELDNKNHVLILCGDLFDRGPDSLKIYEFIKSLPKDRRVLIRGNHEYLLRSLVKRKDFYDHDISNGTLVSLLQLNNF